MDNFRLIKNSKYIYTIMKRFSRKDDNSAIINIGNNSFTAKLLIDYKNRKISFKNDINLITSSEDKVDITFHVRNSLLKARLGIVSIDDEVELEYPDEIFIGHRRQSSRHRVNPNSEVYLFNENLKRVMIYDISKNGLSFYTKDTLEVNSEINNYKLIISGKEIFINGEIIQRRDYKDSKLYAVVFKDIKEEDKEIVFNFIFRDLFPNIKYWWECKEEDIYHIFKESGYLKDKAQNEDENERNWNDALLIRKNSNNHSKIFSDLVYNKEFPITCASALKIYNKTYLAHQLASKPSTVKKMIALKNIYSALDYWLIETEDFEYFVSYFSIVKWHDKMFISIINLVNDKNILDYDRFVFFNVNISNTKTFCETEINTNICYDVTQFISFINEKFGKLETEIYEYNNDFYLGKIKNEYKLNGLHIDRELYEFAYDNRIIGYGVAETFSNGLNLFNLLDTCRVYIDNQFEFLINALLKNMINKLNLFYIKNGKQNYNIFFITNTQHDIKFNNKDEGIEFAIWGGRMKATKNGIIHYKKLFESMY